MSISLKSKSIYENASYVGLPDEIVYIDGLGIAIHDGLTPGGKVNLFQNNPQKNWIRNGGFDIAQNGTEFLNCPTAGNQQLTIDGWWFLRSGGSTADIRTQGYNETGDTSANRMMRVISTSLGNPDSFTIIEQRSFNIHDYAGRDFSFHMPIKTDTPKEMSIDVKLFLDTGTSSDDITVYAGKSWVGSTFDNHEFHCKLPRIPQGLALGSGAHIRVRVWIEAGSDWDSQTGGIGTYAGAATLYMTNIMMAEGLTSSPYVPDPPPTNMARVQQYFEKVSTHIGIPTAGLSEPNSTLFGTVYFQNTKWKVPDASDVVIDSSLNITSPAVQAGQLTNASFNVTGQASSPSSAARVTGYTCNLEIN